MSLARPSANSTPPSLGRHVGGWFDSQVATLYPGCFGLVMATGIISNAFFVEGWRGWSDVLFVVNLVSYPLLVLLTTLRLVRFPRALWADLIDPQLVFSFFTLVAGTSVFGAGIHLRGFATVALTLMAVRAARLAPADLLQLWGHGCRQQLDHGRPDPWRVAHGHCRNRSPGDPRNLDCAGHGRCRGHGIRVHPSVVGRGTGLYGIFIVLFCYRIFFFEVRPDDVTPALWVVMGAAAISTNAGSTLILADTGIAFLHAMRPFIDGITLIVWAWATWWIPLLLLFGIGNTASVAYP